MDAHSMITTIVNQLLYVEGAQDKLVELIWSQWTDEQKKALADESYRIAMEQVGKIIEAKLYALGSSQRRPNLFANHVNKVVRETFETEKVEEAVNSLVKEHLTEIMAGLKTTIAGQAATVFNQVIASLTDTLDPYALRESIKVALRGVSGPKEGA